MNADGTGVTRLTNHPADDSQPTWSGNGKRVAFVSGRDGNEELYVMNPDRPGWPADQQPCRRRPTSLVKR